MAADAAQIATMKELLRRVECRPLADRLTGFLPGTGMSCLDESDPVLGECFRPEAEGGWLSHSEDTELWQLVDEAGGTGSVSRFADWLGGLLSGWESHAAAQSAQDAASAVAPRFDEAYISPMEAYPGWWRGYDCVDGVWKYLQSPSRPSGQASGWMVDTDAMRKSAADSIFAAAMAELRDDGMEATDAERQEIYTEIWAAVFAAPDLTPEQSEAIREIALDNFTLKVMADGAPQEDIGELIEKLNNLASAIRNWR